MDATFDLCGVLRRIRRVADLSQRELARAVGSSSTAIAQAESGARDLPVGVVARAAGLAGLRLALLDPQGREVDGMADGAVRDMGNRRFPAHLDTRYGDEHWWHGPERYSRPQPWYTFDRDRDLRDRVRARSGAPGDHQFPRPGDSPDERRQERRREQRRRREAEIERLRAAGELPAPTELVCCCPPECADLDEGERPVHAAHCGCGCDVD